MVLVPVLLPVLRDFKAKAVAPCGVVLWHIWRVDGERILKVSINWLSIS